jgi:hypothetical protein
MSETMNPLLDFSNPPRFDAIKPEHVTPAIASLEIGQKFQNQILAVRGSRPALDSFKAFRGREPKIDALLRYNGMAACRESERYESSPSDPTMCCNGEVISRLGLRQRRSTNYSTMPINISYMFLRGHENALI